MGFFLYVFEHPKLSKKGQKKDKMEKKDKIENDEICMKYKKK